MKHNRMITPEGMKDILLEECTLRRTLREKAASRLRRSGYREVVTPGVEFYDLFDPSHTGFAQEDLYKMTDNKGRLLVMRPDCTLPIARLAATRLQALPRPLRLWYDEMVYRNNPGLAGRDDEQLQCGMELLGAGGLKADLEALFLASCILQDMVPGYRIELGHAGIFQGLSEELPVDDEEREAIRRAIEAKNYAALSAMLDEIPDTPAVRALQKLPRLFGGPDVLHEARELCGESRASEPLSYLQNLYEKLCDLGLSDHVMFDLGLVQRNDYYTGVVFSAYIPGEGEAVLSGGRYDSLLDWFDQPMPAVGFALKIDAVARSLMREQGMVCPAPQLLVFGEKGQETKALLYMQDRQEKGVVCEYAVCETPEQAKDYARCSGIHRLAIVGEKVREVEV